SLCEEVEFLVNYGVAKGQSGDREGARATLARVEKLLEPGSRPEPLNLLGMLAEGQAKVGEREAALRAVQRIVRAAKEVHDDADPLVSPSVYLALGDYDGAAKSARRSGNSHILS